MKTVYALIWKSFESDEAFDQETFQSRIPQLMVWLQSLRRDGYLIACGGGGFENHSGGLTLITVDSPEHAMELSKANPMNEIGHTELFVWDVFFADLQYTEHISRLQ